MDVLLPILFVMSLFIALLTLSEWADNHKKYVFTYLILLLVCNFWAGLASSARQDDESLRTVTLHKILKDGDTVFYWDQNHKPQVLYGDQALADRESTVVKITFIKAGWTAGMYISSTKHTELVHVDAPAEQTDE